MLKLNVSLGQQYFVALIRDAVPFALQKVKSVDITNASSKVLHTALSSLDALDSKTTLQSGNFSPDDIISYSTSIANIRGHCSSILLWLNFYRQRVMISEARVVQGIQSLIEGRGCELVCQETITTSADDWFARLVKSIRTQVLKGSAVKARSAEYFSSDVIRPVKFVAKTRSKHISSYQLEKATLSYVREALHFRFGSSLSFAAQAQSHLVQCLLNYLGPGCLLLDNIWTLYSNPPHWLWTVDCPKYSNGRSADDSYFHLKYTDNLALTLHEIT
jgi:hypothetical protein